MNIDDLQRGVSEDEALRLRCPNGNQPCDGEAQEADNAARNILDSQLYLGRRMPILLQMNNFNSHALYQWLYRNSHRRLHLKIEV